MESNNANLMLIKKELVVTTNSRGWVYAMKLGEEIVQDAERKALTCEDESKIIGLQRKAQAAREFFTEFRQRVEQTKQVEGEVTTGEVPFVEVCY